MMINNDPVARAVREAYPYKVDLGNCDSEPLCHIGVVQQFACLLAVDTATRNITHASENAAEFVGKPWTDVLGSPLIDILPLEVVAQINHGLQRAEGFETINPIQALLEVDDHPVLSNVIVHETGQKLLLEIETVDEQQQTTSYHKLFARAISRIQHITDYKNLFAETAQVLQQLTAYDRVMVYRFDRDFNGEVIAEALGGEHEPFLGLRYPHSDIPPQARELYKRNRVRLIQDIRSIPSRIRVGHDDHAEALDLSVVGCRGVSPVHLEYLGYMGVNNSLSVAIMMEGKLWGLFALHHYSPRAVDYGMRSQLLFLGDIFSGHLALQTAGRYREKTLSRNVTRLAIGERISQAGDVFTGLTSGSHHLLGFFPDVNSAGILFEGREEFYGEYPPPEDTRQLIAWIAASFTDDNQLVFHHDSIGSRFEPFRGYRDQAAGVLVIFLNPDHTDWICWFRPGVSRSVIWGGKPDKTIVVAADGSKRIGPRRSFSRYIETVHGCSAAWMPEEVDSAFALRITILNSLMRRYAEIRQINDKLQKAYEDLESFSYTVSHDLRAPLRAISGYSEILEEDYGKLLDKDGRSMLEGIRRGVEKMNEFITDILELSRVSHGGLQLTDNDLPPLIGQVVNELRHAYTTAPIKIHIAEDMPPLRAERRLLRQLLTNLVSNAFKYAEPDRDGNLALSFSSVISDEKGLTTYRVSNTGPGIPPEFSKSIFEMFSRLPGREATEGTGIGLAIVDRIVTRHGGEIWVTDDLLGVTFNFYLNSGSSQ